MAKSKEKLTILRITEYRGFYIMVQNYGNFFQYLMYKDKNFYQSYNIITPETGKKHTKENLLKGAVLMIDQAMATADYIIDPDEAISKSKHGQEELQKLPTQKLLN